MHIQRHRHYAHAVAGLAVVLLATVGSPAGDFPSGSAFAPDCVAMSLVVDETGGRIGAPYGFGGGSVAPHDAGSEVIGTDQGSCSGFVAGNVAEEELLDAIERYRASLDEPAAFAVNWADPTPEVDETWLVESVEILPEHFPGAGRANDEAGWWSTATLVTDGNGTFDIEDVSSLTVGFDRALDAGLPPGFDPVFDPDLEFDTFRFEAETPAPATHLLVAGSSFSVGDGGILGTLARTSFSAAPVAPADEPIVSELFTSMLNAIDDILAGPAHGPCIADVAPMYGDGAVDATDLAAMLASWGEACTPVDVNQDERVDQADLVTLLVSWGPCE